MPTPDQLIARIAERQHGAFTYDQALSCGLDPNAVQYRLSTRRWARLHKGVYRLAGTVRTFEQNTIARVLACGPGAVAFRRTVAALFEIEGIDRNILEVAVPRPRRSVLAHQLGGLRPSDVTRVGVIPATKPERMIIDLARVVGPSSLEDALDDTIRRRLVRPRRLEARLEVMERRGGRGLGILLELVRTRTTQNVAGSARENTVRRALTRAGLPEPIRQYTVVDRDGTFIARPDLCYPDRRLYIEYDGDYHNAPRQRRSDNDRQNRLTALGWRPLRFDKVSLRGPMSALVDLVRRSCEETPG